MFERSGGREAHHRGQNHQGEEAGQPHGGGGDTSCGGHGRPCDTGTPLMCGVFIVTHCTLQGDEDGLSGTIMDQAQTSDRLYDADLELV